MLTPPRPLLWAALLVSLPLFGTALVPSPAVAADPAQIAGTWKLITISLVDSELFVIDFSDEGGKLSAKFVATPPTIVKPVINAVELKGDTLTLTLRLSGKIADFSGKLGKEKDGDKVILGALRAPGAVFACRLERTDDKVLNQARPDEALFRNLFSITNERDPKTKLDKLSAIVHDAPGSPKYAALYPELIKTAAKTESPVGQVRQIVNDVVKGAQPYGEAYATHVATQALKALAGQKAYAELAIELAERTEKGFGKDESVETKAEVASALASAAKLAGRNDLAEKAAAKSARLEDELDEEYHKNVPPFKPETSTGRKDKDANRVVLLELFTGAECPPCVAADVAFDALNTTYKPTELITLQYHLHIPGPDPLTNAATMRRQEYYPDFRGTPASYFNGKMNGAGGGYMANAEEKYGEYRKIVDESLETKAQAKIDLKVERKGNRIQVVATAQTPAAAGKKDDKDAAADSPKKGDLKLRLVLAEKQIRYVGGNKLRFHHHVVRAMPGGADGTKLVDGKGETNVQVDLAETRRELETYLSDYAKQGAGFSSPLPGIELKDLTVVAFVQDDRDKTIWQAASAPVPSTKSEDKGE